MTRGFFGLLLMGISVNALFSERFNELVGASYDVGTTNRMVDFSLASYCCGNLGHGCKDWSCVACKRLPCVTEVTEVKSNLVVDANGFVAYDSTNKVIVIAFAGTDPLSIADWIDDIDTVKEDYPYCSGCEVHKGFYDTYKAIQDVVWAAVEGYWNEHGSSTKVQITGHSLGAAMAAHCALDFYDKKGIQPQYVYTYGQPRVGNEAFANYYHSKINVHFRATHHKDPVPHLPSESMGFTHMPLEVFYPSKGNGTYNVCDGSGEDSSCSDQYFEDLNVADHLTYIGYSFTDNYLSCKL